MNATVGLPSEFELIARYFAPLAKGFPSAFGLLDDAAVIGAEFRRELDTLLIGPPRPATAMS